MSAREAWASLTWHGNDVRAALHDETTPDAPIVTAYASTVADALAALAVEVERAPAAYELEPCPHEETEREHVDPDEHPTLTALYCTACGLRVGS